MFAFLLPPSTPPHPCYRQLHSLYPFQLHPRPTSIRPLLHRHVFLRSTNTACCADEPFVSDEPPSSTQPPLPTSSSSSSQSSPSSSLSSPKSKPGGDGPLASFFSFINTITLAPAPPPGAMADAAVHLLLATLAITVSFQARRRILAAVLACITAPQVATSLRRLVTPAEPPTSALPKSGQQDQQDQSSTMPSQPPPLSLAEQLEPLRESINGLAQTVTARDDTLATKLASLDANLTSLRESEKPVAPTPEPPSFAETAELHLLRTRLSRTEEARTTLQARLQASEIALAETQHQMRTSELSLQAGRDGEQALRTQLASAEVRLARLASTERRLDDALRTADELREEVVDLTKRLEESAMGRRDAEREATRFERVVNLLRGRLDGGASRRSTDGTGKPPEEGTRGDDTAWKSNLKSRGAELVPNSIVYDELLASGSEKGAEFPNGALTGGGALKHSSSHAEGIPADGGFADAGETVSGDGTTANGLDDGVRGDAQPLLQAEGDHAFAFSRGEFAAGGDAAADADNTDDGREVMTEERASGSAVEAPEMVAGYSNGQSESVVDDVPHEHHGAQLGRGVHATEVSGTGEDGDSQSPSPEPIGNSFSEDAPQSYLRSLEHMSSPSGLDDKNGRSIENSVNCYSEQLQAADSADGDRGDVQMLSETGHVAVSGSFDEGLKAQMHEDSATVHKVVNGDNESMQSVWDKFTENVGADSASAHLSNGHGGINGVTRITRLGGEGEANDQKTPADLDDEVEEAPREAPSTVSTGDTSVESELGASSSKASSVKHEGADGVEGFEGDTSERGSVGEFESTGTSSVVETSAEQSSVDALTKGAKELVRRGRRRGLTVEEANGLFSAAASKLNAALQQVGQEFSDDELTDRQSDVEVELGSCLVSWSKVNIADPAARSRLGRAIELLERRVERKRDDTTALFNAGLCLCLLAATGESDLARGFYERACVLYEQLLSVEIDSRIGCFNCGLTYVSLGRIAVAAGDDVDVCRGYLNKALERFEKALLMKPTDAKAVSYIDDCRRQLEALRPHP